MSALAIAIPFAALCIGIVVGAAFERRQARSVIERWKAWADQESAEAELRAALAEAMLERRRKRPSTGAELLAEYNSDPPFLTRYDQGW